MNPVRNRGHGLTRDYWVDWKYLNKLKINETK